MTIQQRRFMKQSCTSSISFESLTDETNKSLIREEASPNKADKALKSFLSISSGSNCETIVQAKAVNKSTKIEKFKQEMEDQAAYVNLIYECYRKFNKNFKPKKDIGFLTVEGAAYLNNYFLKQDPKIFTIEKMKSLRLIIETLPRLSNYKTSDKLRFIKNNLMNYYEYLRSGHDDPVNIIEFNPKDYSRNHNKKYFDQKYNEEQRIKKDKELKQYRERMEKRAEIRDAKTDTNRELNNRMAADRLIQGRIQHLDRMSQCKKFHNENLNKSNKTVPVKYNKEDNEITQEQWDQWCEDGVRPG